MEVKKSHDLHSASWRPRRTNGVFPVQTQSLRTRGANVSPILRPKASEPGAAMTESRKI